MNNKTNLPITVIGPITTAPGTGVNNTPNLPITVPGPITKNPVHGTGSSHDPRSPSNTHGRDYCNWGRHNWNSRYGCEFYWSLADGCFFYFYAPANCYYPISVIDQFPPLANAAVAVPVEAVTSRR